MKQKILCICAKGQNRSRYLSEYLKSLGYESRFGGVEGYDKTPGKAPNPVEQKDVDWADLIIITRKRLEAIFNQLFKTNKKILVFDVPDLTPSGKFDKTEDMLRKVIEPHLPFEK
ncbi:MAG: hypothetical protein PVJ67_06525 [Candidatus Pacearchaeota archaeon]|jgi:predicted protein tyrosine phosphatase